MRRAIDITPDVFHLIWTNWKEGDTDENSILRRVLPKLEKGLSTASTPVDRGHRTQYSAEPIKTYTDNDAESGAPKELKLYDRESGEMTPNNYRRFSELGKIRWVDDVRSALIDLGGEADLSRIYDKTEAIRKAAGRSVVKSLDATVRQTIEAHSSDSKNFKSGNADYFEHVGPGRWRLRR